MIYKLPFPQQLLIKALQQTIQQYPLKMNHPQPQLPSFTLTNSTTPILRTTNPQTSQPHSLHLPEPSTHKDLSSWFDSISDLQAHLLGNREHYRIDFQKGKVQILGKHPTKIGGFLRIAELELEKVHGEGYELEGIVSRCQKKDMLGNKQIKDMLGILANHLMKNKKNTQSIVKTQPSSSQVSSPFTQTYPTIKKLQEDLKQKDEVIEVIINKLRNYSDSWDRRMQKLEDRFDEMETKYREEIKKVGEIRKEVEPMGAKDFVDQACYSYYRLALNGNVVTKVSGNEADVFGKTPISVKNTFTLKINHLRQYMCIGLVDSILKTCESFINEPNCVVYYSDGNFYDGKRVKGKVGRPFTQGSLINVCVNIEQGKIQWKVDGTIVHTYVYEKIKDRGIQWVPYVWVIQNQDSFSVIQ